VGASLASPTADPQLPQKREPAVMSAPHCVQKAITTCETGERAAAASG
jgi:hypothetical protein